MIAERTMWSDDKIKMLADSTSTTDGATFCPQSKYEKAFNVSKSLVQLFTSLWCKFYKQQQTNKTQQQQTNKTQQQQTTGLNNNKQLDSTTTTNQLCLTILKHSVTPFPSPLIRDLRKHQTTSVSSDVLQNLVTSYIHMCSWRMMSYDVIASHDLIKELSCTALDVHSTHTYPLWLVPRSWLRWRVYAHIEPPANTCPLCGDGKTTPGSIAIRWYGILIQPSVRPLSEYKFWSTKVLQGLLN